MSARTYRRTSSALRTAGLALVQGAGSHYIELHRTNGEALDIIVNLYDYANGTARKATEKDWTFAIRSAERDYLNR